MARIYVGNLPMDVREREIEDLFEKYGKVTNIELKIKDRPPAFAFVEFDDTRDAEDAVRGRHGIDFAGSRLRVEFSRGGRQRDDRGGRGDRGYGGCKSNVAVDSVSHRARNLKTPRVRERVKGVKERGVGWGRRHVLARTNVHIQREKERERERERESAIETSPPTPP